MYVYIHIYIHICDGTSDLLSAGGSEEEEGLVA
jgi:hypothetical protein